MPDSSSILCVLLASTRSGHNIKECMTLLYQGFINFRGHVTPDTLHIDIKILGITKNRASRCSLKLIHIYKCWQESMGIVIVQWQNLQSTASTSGSFPVLLLVSCLLQYNRYTMDTPARSFTTVMCCLSSAVPVPVLPQSWREKLLPLQC